MSSGIRPPWPGRKADPSRSGSSVPGPVWRVQPCPMLYVCFSNSTNSWQTAQNSWQASEQKHELITMQLGRSRTCMSNACIGPLQCLRLAACAELSTHILRVVCSVDSVYDYHISYPWTYGSCFVPEFVAGSDEYAHAYICQPQSVIVLASNHKQP